MGGGNLCGSLSSSLGRMAHLLLSISSSKPYFEKITVHADDAQPKADTGLGQVNSAITVENLSFRFTQGDVVPDGGVEQEHVLLDVAHLLLKLLRGEVLGVFIWIRRTRTSWKRACWPTQS